MMLSAVAAMVAANSLLSGYYEGTLGAQLSVTIGGTGLEKPLLLWINDGLMAVFFFLVGLELKRELLEGKLKHARDIVLPGAAAAGGMIVPALIFAFLNRHSPETLSGRAIPAATDIAFALGILALLGKRVPASLKVFLLTLAILDDLGAILIIALFYTADLNPLYVVLALAPLSLMLGLNAARIHRVAPILMLGVVLWVLVLKSGVHATLAGVITAFLIPLSDRWSKSPLHALEHAVIPYVLYFIVPVLAMANAGVVLDGLSPGDLFSPLPLGIAAGLVLGKQIGVFGLSFVVVRMGLVKLPHGANWLHVYGVACLAGIGFTMSLFIGGLSFADAELMNDVRLGVLSGSFLSAILGIAVLLLADRKFQVANRSRDHSVARIVG